MARRKFVKHPVSASINNEDGLQVAKRMYQDRQDTLRAMDNDAYRYISKRLSDELKEFQEGGGHYMDFVPSTELRREARDLGYPIRKNRSKLSFPYYVSLK